MLPVVIIAGGVGSRLEPYSRDIHKCLMELEPDVTLLDFTLRKIEKINPSRILIVIRPQWKEVFMEKLKGRAELLETDVEEFGNLYSVSLALKRLNSESFLLLMSDHIFEQSILDKLLSSSGKAAFTVCLDKNPSRAEALEGLKLALKDGEVVYADKSISPRHGIDTGIILCGKDSRTYIEKAIEKFGCKANIADALNLAAADGKVDYVDVTGKLWKDVDTPEDLVEARKVYWQILRREITKPEDGVVSRYLNRPISTRISITIYRKGLNIEPLTVSLISFMLGLMASFLLAMRFLIAGGFLVQVAPILDGVDGELARLYRKATSWGGFLDLVLDRISDIAIVTGLTLSLQVIDKAILLLAILAAANVIFVNYVTQISSSLGINVEKLRRVPATRDVRLFVVFVATLISLPIVALWYLAIVPILYIAYALVLTYTARRETIKLERTKREPVPQIQVGRKIITDTIKCLISNSIKLGLALLILNMITPAVSGITLLNLYVITLMTDHILLILTLIVITYFGYQILIAIKVIIDITAPRLVRIIGVTESTIKHILVDCLYLGLVTLMWFYLPPLLDIYVGEWAYRLSSIATFAFFLLILYDLSKIIYKTFKDIYEKIAEKIAERLHKDSE